MNGLGIIDTDLCMWAGTISTADLLAAPATLGHPTLKAKPEPVEIAVPSGLEAFVCSVNAWVNANPILAGALIAGGYLMLRRKTPTQARRKK
jgi:hypothetical protein